MTFDEYQQFMRQSRDSSSTLQAQLYGLSSECGEVLQLFQKQIEGKHDFTKEELVKELGDVLWRLTAIADDYDVSLLRVAEENVKKLKERYGMP